MEWGRVTETELMPRLVGGDTERCCGKLNKGKGFLKPNFERRPKLDGLVCSLMISGPRVRQVVAGKVIWHKCISRLKLIN
jgi:hypothetical protein